LDKTNEFAQDLCPALLKNLIAVGCAILVKETVNLNKLKNQMGILLGNQQTLPDSHYRRLTRFFDSQIAQRKLWNRSAEAMAACVDDRLHQAMGRPLDEYLPHFGCDLLAVWQATDSVAAGPPVRFCVWSIGG